MMESRSQIILPVAPKAASLLCANAAEKKLYWDRSHYDSPDSQMRALTKSATLYIGNLSFSTRIVQLQSLFSNVGPVKAIVMGLDRNLKTPCGFAFVEYEQRKDALSAVAYISGTKLDEKIVRVELDAGFKPGRQYGRGRNGGQVRDDRRNSFDPKRRTATPRNRKIADRWQAPDRSNDANNGAFGGGNSSGHYGPSAGMKRGRDEYDYVDEDLQPATKNSRFAEGSDDEV
mmetsp:Transcript_18439/g.21269  ORF Transcript_18439/g.21269 Transcript_18439/m.21269 type:complete len:231 (+) Transcript_18439:99-791(+)